MPAELKLKTWAGCRCLGDKNYRHPEYMTRFFHSGELVVPWNNLAWFVEAILPLDVWWCEYCRFFIVDTCGYVIHCTVSHLSYYSTSSLVWLGLALEFIDFISIYRLEVASIVECMQRLSHGTAMWCTSSWTTGRHLKIWGTCYRSGVEWRDPCL